VDVQPFLSITDTLHWSYESLSFIKSIKQDPIHISLKPSVLVSDPTSSWMEQLFEAAIKGNKRKTKKTDTSKPVNGINCTEITLVITNDIQNWTSACQKLGLHFLVLKKEGLSMETIHSDVDVLLCTTNILVDNVVEYSNLIDTLDVGHQYTSSYRVSSNQIQRIIMDNLGKHLPSFSMPLPLLYFGLVIADDMDTSSEYANLFPESLRTIQIFKTHETKPSGLTQAQLEKAYKKNETSDWSVPHIVSAIQSNLFIYGIPKHVLKKFKIFGHFIKNTAVEDKIARIFSSYPSPNRALT
jgi:hypothetical protein